MTSDYLLLFIQFNLAFLFFEKKIKVVEKYNFLETKAIKIFEYEKIIMAIWKMLNYINK